MSFINISKRDGRYSLGGYAHSAEPVSHAPEREPEKKGFARIKQFFSNKKDTCKTTQPQAIKESYHALVQSTLTAFDGDEDLSRLIQECDDPRLNRFKYLG